MLDGGTACVKCGLIFDKYYQQSAQSSVARETEKMSAAREAARKSVARRRNTARLNVIVGIALIALIAGLGYLYFSGQQL